MLAGRLLLALWCPCPSRSSLWSRSINGISFTVGTAANGQKGTGKFSRCSPTCQRMIRVFASLLGNGTDFSACSQVDRRACFMGAEGSTPCRLGIWAHTEGRAPRAFCWPGWQATFTGSRNLESLYL